MSDMCMTEEVILQENGIIRSKNGKILGHLIEHYNEFVESHYNRGLDDAVNRVRREWYKENDKSTDGLSPRDIGIHVGVKSGLILAMNKIRSE